MTSFCQHFSWIENQVQINYLLYVCILSSFIFIQRQFMGIRASGKVHYEQDNKIKHHQQTINQSSMVKLDSLEKNLNHPSFSKNDNSAFISKGNKGHKLKLAPIKSLKKQEESTQITKYLKEQIQFSQESEEQTNKQTDIDDDNSFDDEGNMNDNSNQEPTMLTKEQASKYPYNCIGILTARKNDSVQKIFGTAFLVSEWLVLTVAHNIYKKSSKDSMQMKMSNFLFYPGQSDLDKFTDGVSITNHLFPEAFKTKNNAQNDYAIMILQTKVPRKRYLKLGLNYMAQDIKELYLFGYGKGSSVDTGVAILKGFAKKVDHFINKEKLQLYHSLRTQSGNSGSPIMIKEGQEFVVIAIHKGVNLKQKTNTGRLIDNTMLANLRIWEKRFLQHEIQYVNLSKQQQVKFGQFECIYEYCSKTKQLQQAWKSSMQVKQAQLQQYLKSKDKDISDLRLKLLQETSQKNYLELTHKLQLQTLKNQMLQQQAVIPSQQAVIPSQQAIIPSQQKQIIESQAIMAKNQQLQQKITVLEGKLTVLEEKLTQKFGIPQWRKQSKYFTIESCKAMKINSNSKWNWIRSKQPIQKLKAKMIVLRLVKYGDCMFVGLATDKYKQDDVIDHGSAQTIQFWTYSNHHLSYGCIMIDGKMVEQGRDCFVRQASELSIEININRYTVTFINRCTAKAFSYRLKSECWRKKDIFVIGGCWQKGDSIELKAQN